MNIIIVVLLPMVRRPWVSRVLVHQILQIATCWSSCTIIGGGPGTQLVRKLCDEISGEAAKWRPFRDFFCILLRTSYPEAQVSSIWPSKGC